MRTIKPQIILMDEPFNGLDPTSTIELKRLIRKLHLQGMSIVVSTHNLDILEDLTETIWFIKDGKLFMNPVVAIKDVVYEIKYNYSGDLAVVMKDSNLPFELNEDRLITREANTIEDYLEWLLKHNVNILTVNPVKRNLEEVYREFYNV